MILAKIITGIVNSCHGSSKWLPKKLGEKKCAKTVQAAISIISFTKATVMLTFADEVN